MLIILQYSCKHIQTKKGIKHSPSATLRIKLELLLAERKERKKDKKQK